MCPAIRAMRPIPVALAMLAGVMASDAASQEPDAENVRLAAGWIDATLSDVAASAAAIGEEFGAALADLPPASETTLVQWRERGFGAAGTTGFRTWASGDEPGFQAAFPGLYLYGDAPVTPVVAARLAALEGMLPVLRAAYRSLAYSWVYVTTADEIMMIYPYVPLDEAVNNATPTQTPFYRAADFASRSVGWTAPYLDLVGDGMMITASYPVHAGDAVLGVASRDVTLDELTAGVLGRLAATGAATALLVDGDGLAIAASDPAMLAEIGKRNTQAGRAVLHYRSPENLPDNAGARSSAQVWANAAVDGVIAADDAGGVVALRSGGREVRAAPVPSTGWYVILVSSTDE